MEKSGPKYVSGDTYFGPDFSDSISMLVFTISSEPVFTWLKIDMESADAYFGVKGLIFRGGVNM